MASLLRSLQHSAKLHSRSFATLRYESNGRSRFPGAVDSEATSILRFHNRDKGTAIPTFRILERNGTVTGNGELPAHINKDELLRMYHHMVWISTLDIIGLNAQRQGRISFYMVSDGEEGAAVGSASALSPRDPLFLQYREQGALRVRGFSADDFMAQLFATKDDRGKGRNAPVHYGNSKLHIHSISSPLATQIPQAAGAGYSIKMRNKLNPGAEKQVVACYFGEGAASEGDFHAGMNIAATKKCPVLFICRNNGYAISTPSSDQYAGDGIASRAAGYGIPAIRVDGNDVVAVREVVRQARQLAISEEYPTPVLIEAMSYRVSHHSTSDDSFAYRSKAEVEDWKREDSPITRLRRFMEAQGFWDDDQETALRKSCKDEILLAFAKAEKMKFPPLIALMEGVYADMTEEQVEQVRMLRNHLQKYPQEYDISMYEGQLESLSQALEKPKMSEA